MFSTPAPLLETVAAQKRGAARGMAAGGNAPGGGYVYDPEIAASRRGREELSTDFTDFFGRRVIHECHE
jgi:hypothetical protein